MFQAASASIKKELLAATANKSTKVTTLRCAIDYIKSLQQLIDDINNGSLDPGKNYIHHITYKLLMS
jgi:hypothetical protein